jgi:hypothetical protein
MRRITATAIGMVASAATIVTAAVGAASPVSPASGTVTRSLHPVLTWTVPPGERVEDVYLARSATTTPSGAFYDENVVTRSYGEIASTATSWAPTDALYAGMYWWNVETEDEAYEEHYSIPWQFTIPPTLTVFGARITYHYGLGWAEVDVRYRTNVRTLVVTATLTRLGGRRIWSGRARESFILPGRVEEAEVTWFRLRGVPARRIRLTVTVAGPSVRRRITMIVRAPGFGDI